MLGSDLDFIAFLNATGADTVVQETMQVLYQYPHLFRDFHTFPGSIDFLDVLHIPTGLRIDIIFNDSDGLRSTKLLTYLVHFDERVYRLLMVIKHWATIHDFTRERVLSNYAMILMIVFYLQQKGGLPSIASLQKDAEPCFLDGWNKGFQKIDYESRIEGTFYELVGGFFEYYDAFDFGKYIISTFSGRPIERDLFKDLRDVPLEYSLYKQNVERGLSRQMILKETEMIVQDPFTHFDNLAKHMDSRLLAELKAGFASAVLAYKEGDKATFLDSILSDNR